jgi:hypothetical protein
MTEPAAPKRRGRPPKAKPATQLNPDCTNPACIVTCSPTCENLHDWVDYTEYRRAEREHEMGSDPTLRSKDVI